MPDQFSNFTTPDGQNSGGGYVRPTGTGDNGETWDPVAKKWVPRDQMAAEYNPQAGTNPVDANGNPLYSNANTGGPRTGANVMGGGEATAGRVEYNTSEQGYNSPGAWGGYTGTMVMGPDGKSQYDGSLSGRAADVNRMRGIGDAAANRAAYQNDYTQANADAAMGAQARQSQDDALRFARQSAMGVNSQSQALGQRMLQQGAQTQQAAAMSSRGGSLAQAAAMRQQQNGQGAYMQQGNTALQAQLADEMAAGRSMYQQQATQQRGQDAAAQGLNQQQAVSQMQNEIGQRELNQATQMGSEGMAQNVNKAAQDAALKGREMKAGIDAAASARTQRLADRDMQTIGAGASAGGALIAGGGRALDSGDSSSGESRPDPYSQAVSASDTRTKTGVRSLASAAMARKGGY